jgi:hypothetical protein
VSSGSAVSSGRPSGTAPLGSSVAPASGSTTGRPTTVVGAHGKTGTESAKPTSAGAGLYCSHNAISGRLVRTSPGKAGSFPCYVHSLSGELRKKD